MNTTPVANVLEMPLEEPVLVFTIAMAIFLAGPLIVKRLGQPGIVGIVVFGALVGPDALEIVDHPARSCCSVRSGSSICCLPSGSNSISVGSKRLRRTRRCSG